MESNFYCTCCGNLGVPIFRKNGKNREAGHLKKLYCLHCKREVNHAEVKPYTHYDKECFDLEFKYKNFDELGNRKEDFKQFRLKLRKAGIIEW